MQIAYTALIERGILFGPLVSGSVPVEITAVKGGRGLDVEPGRTEFPKNDFGIIVGTY